MFNLIFPLKVETADFFLIAKQVATVQFLPLSIGLFIRKISADLGEEIGDLLFNVANILFIVLVVLLLGISLNLIPLAGFSALTAIALSINFFFIDSFYYSGLALADPYNATAALTIIISLTAVIVIIPFIVIVLLSVFNLPPDSAAVLAILAASPGAPLITKRSQMAGGHIPYSASIQLTLALIAVIVTPLTLSIFYSLFDLDIEKVKILYIAKQVIEVQFIPIMIGLLLQRFSLRLVARRGKNLILIANILLIIMALVLLPVAIPLIFPIDILSMVAIVIMAIASLATGHFLGGKAVDERSALAIACLARNIGLALFIITLSENSAPFIPALVSYMILGAIVAIPYSTWSKRQLAKKRQNI